MGDSLLFILLIVVCGATIYYFFYAKKAVVHGVILKTPAKKISEVKEGENVRIKGKVVYLGKTMLAPLSKRKCVYYHVTVKDSSHSKEIFKNHINLDEEYTEDVVVFDGENYAVINTNNVVSHIAKDENFYSGFWNISTPELKAFLKKHGERETNYVGWSLDLYASEGILEEGETLTVAGKATWRKTSEFDFKIPGAMVLYINPLNENGVYLSDDPYV